ncbi:hypothetical protein [Streptococcus sanguinis]|uniref:Uncharacterized protein n=1 Tax=Streptococcus sanguinis TaxID=1305 RepID=A0ABD4VKV5_STRSA|nr:hypothetical protein [Streptococcus sanguinis]MCY7035298.1 hypothetical protein [Streptococcus sanguinis]
MKSDKVNLTVRIANLEEFRRLVSEFNQKAQELSSVALELEQFHFKGEIENQAMLTSSNDADSENL